MLGCFSLEKLIIDIFNVLTILVPAALPISLTFNTFYFHFYLSKKGVTSTSEIRLNAAGKSNIIILDKTGTLTEEELDLYGFQSVSYLKENGGSLVFNDLENNSWMYNLLHKEFWKNYCLYPEIFKNDNYKNNIKNSMIYFLECLSCCHDINKINDSTLGRSIDLKIFRNLQWELEKCTDTEEGVIIVFLNDYKIN